MAKLKKFLLRYYPPGVILEYESGGQLLQKSIDLLDLTPEDDVEVVLNHVMRQVTALHSLQSSAEGLGGTPPRLGSDRRLGCGARLVLSASSPASILFRAPVTTKMRGRSSEAGSAAADLGGRDVNTHEHIQEPLITEKHRMPLGKLLFKLLDKLQYAPHQDFTLFKVLRAHILPLTNCAFNKSGDRFITGSYDRTCKVRCTATQYAHDATPLAAYFAPPVFLIVLLLTGVGGACVKLQLHTSTCGCHESPQAS